MPSRPLDVAQHEAAHVVVGVALGLSLCRAVLEQTNLGNGWVRYGYVWFDWRGPAEGIAMAAAAGIAWDYASGVEPYAHGDRQVMRHVSIRPRGIPVYVRAAGAILAQLGAIHGKVTRALLDHDLTGAHVQALARGERLSADHE